jgi:hypothetical protein
MWLEFDSVTSTQPLERLTTMKNGRKFIVRWLIGAKKSLPFENRIAFPELIPIDFFLLSVHMK